MVCPNEKCLLELRPSDLTHFLNEESMSKWEDYSFMKLVEENPADYSLCPTPDCKYVFVWDAAKDSNNFTCSLCNKHYCLNCRCVYHVDQTCKEYQISNKFTVCYAIFFSFLGR